MSGTDEVNKECIEFYKRETYELMCEIQEYANTFNKECTSALTQGIMLIDFFKSNKERFELLETNHDAIERYGDTYPGFIESTDLESTMLCTTSHRKKVPCRKERKRQKALEEHREYMRNLLRNIQEDDEIEEESGGSSEEEELSEGEEAAKKRKREEFYNTDDEEDQEFSRLEDEAAARDAGNKAFWEEWAISQKEPSDVSDSSAEA